MPIYEYECTSCRTVLEVFQRMTEDPLTTCPECSGPVKKLMSMSSFQLKGGGWYADGYSNASGISSGSAGSSGPATTDAAAKSSPGKAEKAAGNSSESSPVVKDKKTCSAAA